MEEDGVCCVEETALQVVGILLLLRRVLKILEQDTPQESLCAASLKAQRSGVAVVVISEWANRGCALTIVWLRLAAGINTAVGIRTQSPLGSKKAALIVI